MKVTPQDIEENIVREDVYRVPGTNTLIVTLVCKNGYAAVGHSSCADNVEFIYEYGYSAARKMAVNEIWNVMGYELRTRIMKEKENGDQSRDVQMV